MRYENVKSIMILGDSVAKGVVLNPEKMRYVFSKQGFIAKLKEKLHPQILDYSRYGSTTGYGQKMLQDWFEQKSPDLVLIGYGNNDCDYKWNEVAENPYATHLPNFSVEEYAENLGKMIETIKRAGKIPILNNLHPLSGEGYFNWFTEQDKARQKATLVWLKSAENIYWWHEMYSYALERTAQSHDVPVVDIRSAFLKQKDYRDFLCGDGIHPNEAGHRLIEDAFMKRIQCDAPELLQIAQ